MSLLPLCRMEKASVPPLPTGVGVIGGEPGTGVGIYHVEAGGVAVTMTVRSTSRSIGDGVGRVRSTSTPTSRMIQTTRGILICRGLKNHSNIRFNALMYATV